MIEVKVKDAALREAAMQDMDAFLGVFINATKEAIGGELNAENMQQLSVAQITLLAYDILHEEVMDGGFVQLIYNGYGGFIFGSSSMAAASSSQAAGCRCHCSSVWYSYR